MGEGIAPVNSTGSGNGISEQFNSITTPPNNLSGISAWGLSIGLGSALAKSFIEKYPDKYATDEAKKNLGSLMQGLMNQVTKSMSKSLDYLKEMDDDEDKCAATSFCG